MTEIRRDHLITGEYDSRQLVENTQVRKPANFTAATRETVKLSDCTVLTTITYFRFSKCSTSHTSIFIMTL